MEREILDKEQALRQTRKRLSVLERQEKVLEKKNRLMIRKRALEKARLEAITRILGADSEDYFSLAAETILKFAEENSLDPRWFYDAIQRPTEYYLTCWWGRRIEVDDPKTAEDYYTQAMQIAGANEGSYGGHLGATNWARAERSLKKAVELARNRGEKKEIAYRWLLNNIDFLDDVYHRFFSIIIDGYWLGVFPRDWVFTF